jgi:hypothetical protein
MAQQRMTNAAAETPEHGSHPAASLADDMQTYGVTLRYSGALYTSSNATAGCQVCKEDSARGHWRLRHSGHE